MENMVIGHTLIKLESVDSTNNYAARLIRETNVPDGTVIMAHVQTEGKGQRGTHWLAQPGMNLTFSVILKPKFLKTEDTFLISQMAALALTDFLKSKGIDSFIKWPNDIWVGSEGFKIAGILIENAFQGSRLNSVIIGIGLNVNQNTFPSDFQACSMAMLNGETYNLEDLLKEFLSFLQGRYLSLQQGKDLKPNYLQLLLGFGQWREYLIDGERIKGCIQDVSRQGLLQMETEKGSLQLEIKEVQFLR